MRRRLRWAYRHSCYRSAPPDNFLGFLGLANLKTRAGRRQTERPPRRGQSSSVDRCRHAPYTRHAEASNGSAGHGANRTRHCKTPATTSIMAATPKTIPLLADSHTICGTVDTRPESAAPAPIPTSNAGSAQQTSVPLEVKMLSIDAARALRTSGPKSTRAAGPSLLPSFTSTVLSGH